MALCILCCMCTVSSVYREAHGTVHTVLYVHCIFLFAMKLMALCILCCMCTVSSVYHEAHGTYIGNIRLESKKPHQVILDSQVHFGASTRAYVIRERPQPIGPGGPDEDGVKQIEKEGSLLGLPESETELDVSDCMFNQITNIGFT